MRDTALTACDLSSNVLRKIPPQISIKFSLITGKFTGRMRKFDGRIYFAFVFSTDLNLSHNEIYKLPDEMADLKELVRLDVSNNYLLNLPAVLFRIPKLRQLRANHNAIIGMFRS